MLPLSQCCPFRNAALGIALPAVQAAFSPSICYSSSAARTHSTCHSIARIFAYMASFCAYMQSIVQTAICSACKRGPKHAQAGAGAKRPCTDGLISCWPPRRLAYGRQKPGTPPGSCPTPAHRGWARSGSTCRPGQPCGTRCAESARSRRMPGCKSCHILHMSMAQCD